MNRTTQITIAQLFGAVRRHRFKSLLAFFIVMGLVTVAFLIWPRKYGSEGRLFVQLGGRNNASLDPTSGTSSISIQDTRETAVRSVAELVRSRAVIEACVDEIGADEILKSPLDDLFANFKLPELAARKDDSVEGLPKEEFDRFMIRERAARQLENSLKVDVEKKTSIISIQAKASSATLAQRIVDAIMRLAREKHLEVHALQGSAKFFDEEFEVHQRELVDAIESQKDFRNSSSFLSIEGARETLQEILSRLENEQIDAEVNLAEANERVSKYKNEMTEIRDVVEIPRTGVEKLSFEDSRTELFKLENDLARAVSLYRPDHPEVKRIESQLKNMRESLKLMSVDRTEYATESNPVFEKVKVDFVTATVDRDAAVARLDSIKEKYAAARERMSKLNNALVEADQLQRNVDIAREYLALFIKRRGESKVLDEMDKMRISEVVIAQPGNFVVKKISPRGSVMLPAGLGLALLTALATALFFERNHLSATLGEEDVEQVLDLPVLVTLPRVYSSRNMVN